MSYCFVDLKEDLKKAITRRDIKEIWETVQRDMKSRAWKEASELVYIRYKEIKGWEQKRLETFM